MIKRELKGVCAKNVTFTIDLDGNLHDIVFEGGCNGNLKAIAKLLEGKPAKDIVDILSGIECKTKGTSCADQFAQIIRSEILDIEYRKSLHR